MTVLAPKSQRDELGIDCVERAIVYATLLLRYANEALEDQLPQQFANAVRLTISIRSQDDQQLSFFVAEVNLPFESQASLKTAWSVAENVQEFSSFDPNPFEEISNPYDFDENPVAEMPEDPEWVTSVERYLAWCACLLRANTVLNSSFIQIAILEDAPNFPTFSVRFSLPFAYSRYFLSGNLIESLIGVTANLEGSPIATPINPILSAAEEIRDLLETLIEEDRLDASAIKNLPSGGNGEGGNLSATQVRDLLTSLTGTNRLAASAIRDIPVIAGPPGPQGPAGPQGSPGSNATVTASGVRDLLQGLAGGDRLDASAIKNLPIGQGGTLSATQIRDLLAALIGEDRLDASAIKNLPIGEGGNVPESRLIPEGGNEGQVLKKGPNDTVVWGEDLQSQVNNEYSTFRQAILSQSPVVYLPLDETTGNISNNVVDSNNNGVYPQNVALNQPSLLKSFKGKSVTFFSGVDNSIIIPYIFSDSFFTAGCLLKVNSLNMLSNFLKVNLIVGGQRAQLALGVATSNYSSQGDFLIGFSQNVSFYNTSIRLGTSENFICMTLNNSTISYYVNGVKILTNSTSGSSLNPVNENNQLLVGNFTGANSGSLNLSDVFLFDKVLSDLDINELNSSRF